MAEKTALKTTTKKQASREFVRVRSGIDRPFLIIVLLLVAIGTIMVFSSSYAYANSKYEDSYFFAMKQVMWVAVGTSAMLIIAYFVNYLFIKYCQQSFQ